MVWVIKIPHVDDVIMNDPNVFIKADASKGSGEHIAPMLYENEQVGMTSESLVFPKRTHCVVRCWRTSYQNANITTARAKLRDSVGCSESAEPSPVGVWIFEGVGSMQSITDVQGGESLRQHRVVVQCDQQRVGPKGSDRVYQISREKNAPAAWRTGHAHIGEYYARRECEIHDRHRHLLGAGPDREINKLLGTQDGILRLAKFLDASHAMDKH
ncbi:hypothetical protein BS47DRAFT_1400861 [Hydnum rufescens UP504]|uniref:Uncharacterized protein n=1 Tax=Hydnum rufescens UP504 TaxID=1448309 RepID=A0A9P6AFW7_9AGAM|nr:hypothetical protein BS47DRAFT_1400861 [Hydnum rufescens UP504]